MFIYINKVDLQTMQIVQCKASTLEYDLSALRVRASTTPLQPDWTEAELEGFSEFIDMLEA